MIQRSTLVKIHLLLATFMLPIAMMFLLTGALYTWGIKGHYDTNTHEIALDAPLVSDLGSLMAVAQTELTRLGIEQPTGSPGIKTAGTSFRLEWTGSNRDVLLAPTEDPLVARLSIRDTQLHRVFVQLHKAKGGSGFKIYAALFALALFLILGSGFLMAWQAPRYRKPAIVSLALGTVVFVVMVVAN
jgi:uncharacterized iron-regulated membrane protein